MEYEVDICRLSPAFFAEYPPSNYPEIMTKDSRPYTCLMIETHKDYLICIPFRSSIHHDDAFLFTGTNRSRRTRSGLDYKKAIIIKDTSYIDSNTSIVVDNDEYTAMITNITKIVNDVHSYISKYINHVNGTAPLHEREFTRRYQYSTLPYFHDILGISQHCPNPADNKV